LDKSGITRDAGCAANKSRATQQQETIED